MSNKKTSRIFINYRRDDAGGVAGRLADSLGAYFGEGRVFRDVDGIEGGANFEEVLKQTADAADAMIVLIGRRWVSAVDANGQRRLHDPQDWVAREIAAALEKKIPVYPVLIEDAAMPRVEELPASLQPMVRLNAVSISDSRWNSDVTRLAKIVAIDIPGSEAERKLHLVRLAISIALFAAITLTTGLLTWNVGRKATEMASAARQHNAAPPEWPLALWQSGITFVVIVGCAMLLFLYAPLVDASRRRMVYLSGWVGLIGTLISFLSLKPLQEWETIGMFLGSTITATAVLVLMNLSGFKAK